MALADTAKLVAVLELKDLFSDRISRAERSLNKFESRSTKAGRQIGIGILRGTAVAVGALGTFSVFFTKALGSASDLSETISKVGVVFGQEAARIRAFGKTSAEALGLSENAALGAAATYGNLFVSMGLADKQSADMSLRLVKLAADLASFNNIDPAEALEKLRAGLTGESEPLKTLGINLNEQTLKAKALELGLVKLSAGQKNYTAVLTPAVKAQAAYALILEQSKTAQGDFERTQGGLANQTRILKANWEDLKATLAGPSLPQVAKIMQAINKAVKENQPEIAKLGESIAGLFSDQNIKTGTEFLKGAFDTARETAPIVASAAKATFGFVQGAVGLFKSLPPEIQKLAVGAFAINKLTGGLVTNIAGGIIETVGKQFLQRGGTPANPLFVADVTGGIAKAGAAGAVSGTTSKLGRVGSAIGKVFIVGAAVGVFAELAGILGDQSKSNTEQEAALDKQTRAFTGNASLADLQRALANIEAQEKEINAGVTLEAVAFAFNIDGVKDAVQDQKETLRAAIAKQTGVLGAGGAIASALDTANRIAHGGTQGLTDAVNNSGGKLLSGVTSVVSAVTGMAVSLNGFKSTIAQLNKSRDPKAIENAIKTGLGLLSKGRGNISDTKGLLSGFKTALKNTHDPKLRAALQAAIHKVEARLPARTFAAQQLRKADALIRDGKVTNRDIKDLKTIERALKDRGLPHAASVIREKITTAQHAQVEASRWAGSKAASAIRAKKWQFTTNVTVNTEVSIKNQIRREHQLARVSATAS